MIESKAAFGICRIVANTPFSYGDESADAPTGSYNDQQTRYLSKLKQINKRRSLDEISRIAAKCPLFVFCLLSCKKFNQNTLCSLIRLEPLTEQEESIVYRKFKAYIHCVESVSFCGHVIYNNIDAVRTFCARSCKQIEQLSNNECSNEQFTATFIEEANTTIGVALNDETRSFIVLNEDFIMETYFSCCNSRYR